MRIRFGTDGWRAVIAEEYTFANVRRVCAGIEKALRGSGDGAVVLGYDTRFLSRRFAEAAAETLMAAGRHVVLTNAPCPTPASSCQVVARGAPFAIIITASHNPSSFNGVKVKDASGSSAEPEITSECERAIPREVPPRLEIGEGRRRGLLEEVSFFEAQRDRLASMVDLQAIRGAGFKVVTDSMHGACGRLLEKMLAGGSTAVTTLHAEPDPLFGGMHPEPLEQNLEGLRGAVVSGRADVGLATDGDGDRIGAFDGKGRFVSPLRIAPLLALSLIKKGRRGPLGKTFANTLLLDRIARRYGLPFSTFPVGFKYIASEMKAGRMLLGGEESGGIGVQGYIPERDGTLISLMILQAMVEENKPLSSMVAEMGLEFGELHYSRRDIPLTPEVSKSLVVRLASHPPDSLGGMKITGVDELDGLKLLFDAEGWILFRASGTEPVLRVYAEAPTPPLLDAIMSDAMTLIS